MYKYPFIPSGIFNLFCSKFFYKTNKMHVFAWNKMYLDNVKKNFISYFVYK